MTFGFRFSDNYNYRFVESLNNYINWMNYVSSCLISVHHSISTFNQQMNSLLEDESYLTFNFSVASSFEKIEKELTYFLGPTYFSKENTVIHQNNKEKKVTFGQLTEACEKENSIIPEPYSQQITELFQSLRNIVESILQINQSIIEYLTTKKYIEDYKQKLMDAYQLIQNMEEKFDQYYSAQREVYNKMEEVHVLNYQYLYYPANQIYLKMEGLIIDARQLMFSFKGNRAHSPKSIEAWTSTIKDELANFDTHHDQIMKEVEEIDIQHWEKDVPKDYLSSRYEMFICRLKAFLLNYQDFYNKEDSSYPTYFSKAYYFYNRQFFFAYKNDLISYYNSSLFVSNTYYLKKPIEPMWFKMIDPRKK